MFYSDKKSFSTEALLDDMTRTPYQDTPAYYTLLLVVAEIRSRWDADRRISKNEATVAPRSKVLTRTAVIKKNKEMVVLSRMTNDQRVDAAITE